PRRTRPGTLRATRGAGRTPTTRGPARRGCPAPARGPAARPGRAGRPAPGPDPPRRPPRRTTPSRCSRRCRGATGRGTPWGRSRTALERRHGGGHHRPREPEVVVAGALAGRRARLEVPEIGRPRRIGAADGPPAPPRDPARKATPPEHELAPPPLREPVHLKGAEIGRAHV